MARLGFEVICHSMKTYAINHMPLRDGVEGVD